MVEKKKTEITIGFTHHTPSFIEKELENMRKADVILFESPTYRIEQLKEGTIDPYQLASTTNFPVSAERMYRSLKWMSAKGKPVFGYEDFNNPLFWSNEERAKYKRLKDETESFFKPRKDFSEGKILKSAMAVAELTNMRDKKAAEWIKHNLPKFEGKRIYVSAGSTHTALYHTLKRELEPKGVSVKPLFLAKGFYKDARTMEKYSPYSSLGRALAFKTPSSRNERELKKRLKDAKSYLKKAFKLSKKYAKTMPWEYALERAELETINSWKGRGMLKRVFRKR
jgi:hypothetical protein